MSIRLRTALLAAGLAMPLAGCGEETHSVVKVDDPREANRVLVYLEGDGVVGARIRAETEQRRQVYHIVVPADQASRARRVLVANDLPRTAAGGFDQMLSSTGLIPTAADERARLMHAIAGELQRTFETYDGVVSARVHVVLPERDLLESTASTDGTGAAATGPTASVVLKVRPSTGTATPSAMAVREVVARAVPGLADSSVAVQITESAMPPALPATRGAPTVAATAAKSPAADRLVQWLSISVAVLCVAVITLGLMLLRSRGSGGGRAVLPQVPPVAGRSK